jgi:hypothetical protein
MKKEENFEEKNHTISKNIIIEQSKLLPSDSFSTKIQ